MGLFISILVLHLSGPLAGWFGLMVAIRSVCCTIVSLIPLWNRTNCLLHKTFRRWLVLFHDVLYGFIYRRDFLFCPNSPNAFYFYFSPFLNCGFTWFTFLKWARCFVERYVLDLDKERDSWYVKHGISRSSILWISSFWCRLTASYFFVCRAHIHFQRIQISLLMGYLVPFQTTSHEMLSFIKSLWLTMHTDRLSGIGNLCKILNSSLRFSELPVLWLSVFYPCVLPPH